MTIKPEAIPDREDSRPQNCPDANGQMHKHSWQWQWVNGVMTDRVKCMNCGAEDTVSAANGGAAVI